MEKLEKYASVSIYIFLYLKGHIFCPVPLSRPVNMYLKLGMKTLV